MQRAAILLAAGLSACAPAAVTEPDPPEVSTVALSASITSTGRLGGVSADADGNVYVSNFGASVWRVDPEGRVTEVSNQIRGTSGNAVDRQGRLYQASFLGNTIVRFDESDEVEVFADAGLDGPVGLAIDDDGTVFVCNCNANSIAAVSPAGEVRTVASGPMFACPNGITLGPDGAAYVVSFSNPHVVRVTREGSASLLTSFPGSGNAHIAFAAGGFFVTRIDTNEIMRVELDGSFARWAGTGVEGLDDGPLKTAALGRPNGIAVSADGRFLYVNNIAGGWRGDAPTELVLRRLGPLDDGDPVAGPGRAPLEGAPESMEIAVGEFVFDALAAGPAGGEAVFLLHGFPQTSFAFRHQLDSLAAAGFRAIAPDQRGYSPGARPDAVAAYAVTNLVDDVVGMADALGIERFHLVGHDWGGAVAWVTALRFPGRVRSLAVLSTPHFSALSAARAEPGGDQASRSAYFDTWSKPGAEVALLEDDAAQLRAIWSGLDQAAVAEYLRVLGEPEALRAALAWYGAAFGGTPSAAAPGPPPPPIRVPTLYVWSTEDQAFGREAALATAQFVTGPYRFVVLDGISHWLPEHAPERTAALLLEHVRRQGS